MIERMTNVPTGVLAFTAHGTVTADDYRDLLVPALEQALERTDKVPFLYHFAEDAEGFEAAALWEDAKVGMHHMTSFERIAVVTDKAWLKNATKALGFLMPCPIRVFENAALDEAKVWVSGAPAS